MVGVSTAAAVGWLWLTMAGQASGQMAQPKAGHEAAGAAADADVFVDGTDTFVRLGSLAGVTKGLSLEVIDGKGRKLGVASVLEVWPSICRVNLDDAATRASGTKRARLIAPAVPATVAPATTTPATTASAPQAPVPPPPPPSTPMGTDEVAAPAGSAQAVLPGHAYMSNPPRIIVGNDSSFDWHGCTVRLHDGRYFRLGRLRAGQEDGIMMFRFSSGVPEGAGPPGVTMSCIEGVGRFSVGAVSM